MTTRWAAAMAALLIITTATPTQARADTTEPVVALEGNETISISDPQLLERIGQLQRARTESVPMVPVEILTANTNTAAGAVAGVGGSVVGTVTGHLVQATVPLNRLSSLANAAGVGFVRYPRAANRVPGLPSRDRGETPSNPASLGPGAALSQEAIGTGTVSGEGLGEVFLTNADHWQDEGYLGQGVKVGIVDFFDIGDWNATESGTLPDSAHRFCRDSLGFGMCSGTDLANVFDPDGNFHHGLGVAEIIKDMAPAAELYLASVSTTAELQQAVDFFVTNGVKIITRSLGAAYDGPGDGTGALDAVADYAVSKGITWFNSGGNDAYYQYYKVTVPTSLTAGNFVDFNPNPAITDTWLRIDGYSVSLDGIRWSNDWYLPAAQRTDYTVQVYEVLESAGSQSTNPSLANASLIAAFDADQRNGAFPLEGDDYFYETDFDNVDGVSYIRIRLDSGSTVGTTPDTIELALSAGLFEEGYLTINGSAAKPVVDSKNPGVVSVGAVESHPDWQSDDNTVGYYSSRGPTTDGRVKPDMSAPSGFPSVALAPEFHGTSSAAPTAAGIGALLLGAGLAVSGQPLAAAVKRFTADLGTSGPDNAYGVGVALLPDAPEDFDTNTPLADGPEATAASYVPKTPAVRILDTRPNSSVGPSNLTGVKQPQALFELPVATGVHVPTDAVAAVVNITSVNSIQAHYVQVAPYLRAAIGGTSTLNITTIVNPVPNFAIVPIGVDGKISIYLPTGGHIIIDLLGYYVDAPDGGSAEGRFVPLATPERWMDTRGPTSDRLPVGFASARAAAATETVEPKVPGTTAVPVGEVSALVVTVTATNAVAPGYLRAQQKNTTAVVSTVNYLPVNAVANTTIVPVGADGKMSVFTTASSHIVVDVVGYITSDVADVSETGLFIPVRPGRAYDSRKPTPVPLTSLTPRTLQITGLSDPGNPIVPDGVAGVSANLTVTGPAAAGWLRVYPNPSSVPPTSNLNYTAGLTVAAGALVALHDNGTLTATMSAQGHFIIDVNGYFLS